MILSDRFTTSGSPLCKLEMSSLGGGHRWRRMKRFTGVRCCPSGSIRNVTRVAIVVRVLVDSTSVLRGTRTAHVRVGYSQRRKSDRLTRPDDTTSTTHKPEPTLCREPSIEPENRGRGERSEFDSRFDAEARRNAAADAEEIDCSDASSGASEGYNMTQV